MKKNKGFTLMESVLAMIVAAIAIPGVILVFNEVMKKSINDEVIYTATMLAEGELERVIQKDFVSITDENRNSPVSFGGNFSGYTWQIRVDAVPTALASDPSKLQYKQIEARVTNSSVGDVSLFTVATNN